MRTRSCPENPAPSVSIRKFEKLEGVDIGEKELGGSRGPPTYRTLGILAREHLAIFGGNGDSTRTRCNNKREEELWSRSLKLDLVDKWRGRYMTYGGVKPVLEEVSKCLHLGEKDVVARKEHYGKRGVIKKGEGTEGDTLTRGEKRGRS